MCENHLERTVQRIPKPEQREIFIHQANLLFDIIETFKSNLFSSEDKISFQIQFLKNLQDLSIGTPHLVDLKDST